MKKLSLILITTASLFAGVVDFICIPAYMKSGDTETNLLNMYSKEKLAELAFPIKYNESKDEWITDKYTYKNFKSDKKYKYYTDAKTHSRYITVENAQNGMKLLAVHQEGDSSVIVSICDKSSNLK